MTKADISPRQTLRQVAALLSVALLAMETAQGQVTGTFPPQPHESKQITYTISGIGDGREEDDTTERYIPTRIIRGRLGEGELRISGTALVPFQGMVSVTITMGGQTKQFTKGDPRSRVEFQNQTPPPIAIPFDLVAPIGSTAANASFTIVASKQDEGWPHATRLVRIKGSLSMPGPAPKPGAVASLDRLLELYRQHIPPGPMATGVSNNALSWLFGVKAKDEVGDPVDLEGEFSCGAYQRKVLAFLDSLRNSDKPAERALLQGWDYGPIQAWFGGHQAVALYRTGTGWLDEGNIVLDPWPNQKPEHWAVGVWVAKFAIIGAAGFGGSEVYKAGYPTVGGQYEDPKLSGKITPEEDRWWRSLPTAIRTKLSEVKGPARTLWIKTNYARRFLNTRVIAQCPVELLLTDAQGRRSGFLNGEFKNEIPRVRMLRLPDEKGGWWTQMDFPREDLAGSRTPLSVRGTATGSATILVAHNAQSPAGRVIDAYQLPVVAGQITVLEKLAPGAPLLSDGKHIAAQRPTVRMVGTTPELTLLAPGAAPVAPVATERTVFHNENPAGVMNNPTQPTIFQLAEPTRLTMIRTYHWNNGQGTSPGTIELLDANARTLGRWQATLYNRVYWIVTPNINISGGTYQVRDSSPATWAHNTGSSGMGFTSISGISLSQAAPLKPVPKKVPPQPKPKPVPSRQSVNNKVLTAPSFSVNGTYNTTWGDIVLKQTGNSVSGTYTHDDGRISGTLQGNVLTGTWTEAPSRRAPDDAGDLKFTFNKDGSSFTGVWRYGSTGDMSAGWDGQRK